MKAQYGLEIIHEISTSVIYLMGASFVLGSFFTLLLLVLFEVVRSRNIDDKSE